MKKRVLLVMLAVMAMSVPFRDMDRPRAEGGQSPGASPQEDAASLVRQSQEAFHYAGTDLKARVKMTLLTKEGQQRLRELTMLRKNETGGDQRYFLYFHGPADVRGTVFMVYKYPNREDDRWLFLPALNGVFCPTPRKGIVGRHAAGTIL